MSTRNWNSYLNDMRYGFSHDIFLCVTHYNIRQLTKQSNNKHRRHYRRKKTYKTNCKVHTRTHTRTHTQPNPNNTTQYNTTHKAHAALQFTHTTYTHTRVWTHPPHTHITQTHDTPLYARRVCVRVCGFMNVSMLSWDRSHEHDPPSVTLLRYTHARIHVYTHTHSHIQIHTPVHIYTYIEAFTQCIHTFTPAPTCRSGTNPTITRYYRYLDII